MPELLYKDPWQQILDDVNLKNSDTLYTPVTTDNVKPSQIDVINADTGDSTIVLVSGNSDVFTSATLPLSYKRYVSTILFKSALEVDVTNGETYPVMLSRICEDYSIPPFTIRPDSNDSGYYDFDSDVLTTVVPSDVGSTNNINIPFYVNSIGYIGNLPVKVSNVSDDLSKIITETSLDVLVYPNEPNGKKSLNTLCVPIVFELYISEADYLQNVGQTLPAESKIVTTYPTTLAEYYYDDITTSEAKEFITKMTTLMTDAEVIETNMRSQGANGADLRVYVKPAVTDDEWGGAFVFSHFEQIDS